MSTSTITTTKGWHFTTGPYPRDLKLGDIPIQREPAAHEIIVRVKAAAINPVDIQIMNLPVWPYVPAFVAPEIKGTGKDFAGVVEAAGEDTKWKEGDEIFGLYFGLTVGTCQQLVAIDTNAAAIVPKPSEWSWSQAAALPLVYLTARTTIASIEPFMTTRKTLVVLGGSSATGMYAVHLAKARGWQVVATCSSRNTDFVRSMGADEVIDYTAPSTILPPSSSSSSAPGSAPAVPGGHSVAERVRKFAPEAIVDCVGGSECVGLARRYVTIVGDKTGRASMGGRAIYLWNPQMVLRHFLGYLGVGRSYACVNLEVSSALLEETLRLERAKIVVDSEFAFEEGREAFERLNTGRARGKVVVKVDC